MDLLEVQDAQRKGENEKEGVSSCLKEKFSANLCPQVLPTTQTCPQCTTGIGPLRLVVCLEIPANKSSVNSLSIERYSTVVWEMQVKTTKSNTTSPLEWPG